MPATSKAQQQAAGAALAAKRGETPKSELDDAARQMYETMTESQLEELASTSHEGLPEHAKDRNRDGDRPDHLRQQQQQNQRQQAGGQGQNQGQNPGQNPRRDDRDNGKADRDSRKEAGNPNRDRETREDSAAMDQYGQVGRDRLGDQHRRSPDEQRQFDNDRS